MSWSKSVWLLSQTGSDPPKMDGECIEVVYETPKPLSPDEKGSD